MNLRKTLTVATATALLVAAASLGAEPLTLNGVGMRTMPILGSLYELSLYLPAEMKGASPQAIIEDMQPMELVLVIRSGLITRERFVDATTEGFSKSARTGYPSDQTASFLEQFDGIEFKKGDAVIMRYGNGALETTYRQAASNNSHLTEKKLGRIPGIQLKRALWAIWLGDMPVQKNLKKGLLGE